MATYTPFDYTGDVGPRQSREETWGDRTWTESPAQYTLRQQGDVTDQYRDWAGDQFKGLFDMVNANRNQSDPLASLSAAPRYNQYGGTRADFTTGGERYHGDEGSWETSPTVFDQQGYLDARFGNINNYLSNLGSFFGNMGRTGGSNERVQQAAIERANYAANLPQAGLPVNSVGVPQAGGLSGFAQAAPGSNYGGWGGRQVSGGWGSHPVVGGLLG